MTQEEMITAHDGLEDGVYLVMVFDGGLKQHGIFTKFENAKAWMGTFPSSYNCLCAPFVLDNPDYGNVKKEEMQ